MAEVTITIRPNGPYIVSGPVSLRDVDGNEFTPEGPVFKLCRCGGSTTKPFCDGTHSTIGFLAATRAVEKSS